MISTVFRDVLERNQSVLVRSHITKSRLLGVRMRLDVNVVILEVDVQTEVSV